MSILSDYKRLVEEPRIASLEATIRSLRQRVAELEPQPPLPEAPGDVEAIREACAKVADEQAKHAERLAMEEMTDARVTVMMASERIAAAIRSLPLPKAKEEVEPVAFLHALHMEGGQTYTRLSFDDGTDEDEPRRTAFGVPGRDYSEEYSVTSQPLYSHPPTRPETDRVTKGDIVRIVLPILRTYPGKVESHNDATARQARQIAEVLSPHKEPEA